MKAKHNTRINQRRVRNINALRVLAMYGFDQYLQDNGFTGLSKKQKATKFKKYFVEWLELDISYDYWRHIEKGRNLCKNEYLIALEDRLNLEKGFLDTENEDDYLKALHFYNCVLFVGQFISKHNIKMTEKKAAIVADDLYQATDPNQPLSNDLLSHLL